VKTTGHHIYFIPNSDHFFSLYDLAAEFVLKIKQPRLPNN